MTLPRTSFILRLVTLLGLISFTLTQDIIAGAEDLVGCPPLAPGDFDCSRQGYMECVNPDWPSESDNFEHPQVEERSLPGSPVTEKPVHDAVFKHYEDFNVTAFKLLRSKNKAKRATGIPNTQALNDNSTSPNALQARGTCCRPTWECWDFVRTVEVLNDYRGRAYIEDHETFRKVLCCLERYWEPTPDCPDGPLRQIPDNWLEPPDCSET